MLGNHSTQCFIPRDYDIFSGLDVDKRSISVTFTDHNQMLKSMRIPYSANHLLNYVRKHFSGQKVAFSYEAGPTGYGLWDELTQAGYPCLVVSPSMVPTAPGHHVKTNRLDSQKLSTSLRGGQLKSIHVPSLPYRQLRHLVQLRDTYARQSIGFKNRIKALLLFEGLSFPEAPEGSQWSRKVLIQLQQLPCGGAVRFKLDHLLSSLTFAQEQMVQTQKEIRRFCRHDPELHQCIQYLTSIPGIGWIVASHLLARMGDWRQIKNSRQVASFLGLVPQEDSTGTDVRRGSITRTGDSHLQRKLIQSAWSAIRQDAEFRSFYDRIYHRHPRDRAAKKAIVAVAHKLATRVGSVLKNQKYYRTQKEPSSDPLTKEEIIGPRERLVGAQNNQEDVSPS